MQSLQISRSCRQARSSRPRRPRTEGFEFSKCRCGSSSIRTTIINEGNDNSVSRLPRKMPVFSISESTASGSRKHNGIVSEPVVAPAFGTESVIQNALSNNCNNQERCTDLCDGVDTDSNSGRSLFTADKSMSPASGRPDELRHPIQHDQTDDMLNITSSSGTKDESVEERRGKRKRKLKVHFDELKFPEKSVRRVRRVKIMRHLGLVAPAGSPYSITHGNAS
ncbi:hypothetical protein J5N97_028712 [Dioscorea zingiberensis]|uniref:Uncharacterized protein n=1 Tax=Dioscorea zingiberensis TaxID=325984 RepID=A0A9D5BZD3_9LILI|nr:hypothetical protein J5N97_028712 [Dioscorea zingiberensis]